MRRCETLWRHDMGVIRDQDDLERRQGEERALHKVKRARNSHGNPTGRVQRGQHPAVIAPYVSRSTLGHVVVRRAGWRTVN